jgi:predicted anti-sigma-YlaC factor YlaD
METEKRQLSIDCFADQISAYIDGELSSGEELQLEAHVRDCSHCAGELKLQRQFLCALDATLDSQPDIKIPVDFTKVIVANAESHLSGLRRQTERFNAAFICSGIFLIMMFSVGAASGDALGTVSAGFEKALVIGSFLGHMAYDIAIGVVIVIRSISSQLVFGGSAELMFLTVSVGFPLYILSRVAALFGRG